MLQNVDVIAAIATAQGRGGVGVVRVSGRGSEDIALAILGKLPNSRYATYCDFLGDDGGVIDQGIAIYFPGPNSFTGENVLELQGHGGFAVQQLLLKRCLSLGARLAQPGEFTQRAFLNNKIDLAQAESIADLIEATTAEGARSALRSLRGDFSSTIHSLVTQLIELRMLVEAMLDFPEEEIDESNVAARDTMLCSLCSQLSKIFATAKQGNLLREGAHIVIAGQPNVGKSSLLNRLAGDDVAIVSDIPGTTRDVIRQYIQIRGVPLHIMDTAGLRESEDRVEQIGIERTHQTLHRADLILLLVDASVGVSDQDIHILESLPRGIPVLIVNNKSDISCGVSFGDISRSIPCVSVSAKTGFGMESLREEILLAIGWTAQESGAFMARERHLAALSLAQTHLLQASDVINSPEFFAEELRLAQRALNQITGEFTPDDLLGEIFSRFCIGK